MKFKEIIEKVKSGEIKLRWDLTPQRYTERISGVEMSSQKDIEEMYQRIEEKTGCYFYVDVWDMRAQLFLACNNEKGNGKAEVVEGAPVSNDILVQAIEEAGGAINRSGWYPINDKIKKILKKALENG